jgi:endonuclease-3
MNDTSKVVDNNSYENVSEILIKLRNATQEMVSPAALEVVRLYGRNPFLVLVSCILSLRTKDTVSLPISIRLFSYARTPQELLNISLSELKTIIYPVGFYRQKSKQLHGLCFNLIEHYKGLVPFSKEELLSLPGVGPKTANLVLGEGFGIPAICVDTHVHRIANRLGLITTKTPEETEKELERIVPIENWIELNRLLVMWGQNQCTPVLPRCSTCPIAQMCLKKNVMKNR